MPEIDPERLLETLRRLATFGAWRTGVHRPTYSPQDMESRRWLAASYADCGLAPEIDGLGNVLGRAEGKGRRLLVGSHAESQNHAGWLDGALGVVYGLELARAFSADPDSPGLIEPVAWADEESHFLPLMGSRSFTGEIGDAELSAASNVSTGEPLAEALRSAGLSGLQRAKLDPGRYIGYLEAHIEQGDRLEAAGMRLGVVTAIVGIWQYRIAFHGVQNHAGTTRMEARRDAGLAAARLVVAINEKFPEVAAERTVWTTGRMSLEPGAPAIIPGKAEILFQFRDEDPEVLLRLDAALRDLVAATARNSGCTAEIDQVARGAPVRMHAAFCDAIEQAALNHAPGSHIRMPSGAGHDAQILGKRIPAGMLFVPSIGGVSHHWDENTSDADIVLGCQVLADAAARLLRGGAPD